MSGPQERLGRYLIERELGRGGMGVVYAALDPALGRRVAVKQLLAAHALGDATALARFEREGAALARLRHPAIVRVHEVGHAAKGPFLVLDFVEGESLQARLERTGPLPLPEVLRLGASLADALAHAHAAGVLHRDLKPENVLLDEQGAARLVDFGVARDLAETRERLTRTGELLGTPAFMAPEQADGRVADVDERTDVYGLSATLYAAATGRRPFEAAGDGVLAVLQQVLTQPPPPPSARLPTLPRELERLLLAGLAKRREDRPPSAEALRDALVRLAAGEPGPAPRARRGVAAALAVLALGAGLALLAGRGRAPAAAPRAAVGASSPPRSEPSRSPAEQARGALAALLERSLPRARLSDELAAWWDVHEPAADPEARATVRRLRRDLAREPLETIPLGASWAAWTAQPDTVVLLTRPDADSAALSRHQLLGRATTTVWREPVPRALAGTPRLKTVRGATWAVAGAQLFAPSASGEPARLHPLGGGSATLAVAPDGRRAAVVLGAGTDRGPFELVVLEADGRVAARAPLERPTQLAAFVDASALLLVSDVEPLALSRSRVESLELWRLEGGGATKLAETTLHAGGLKTLALLDPARVALGGSDGVIHVHSLPALTELPDHAIDPDGVLSGRGVRRGYYRTVTSLAVAPAAGRLYAVWQPSVGPDPPELACFDLRTRAELDPWPVSLPARAQGAPRLALSPDGRRLLLATGDRVEVWSTPP